MFLWRASLRNRLTIAMCAFSIVSGCAMQQFLRVDERRVDERLRFFLGGGGNSLVLSHGAEAFLIDTKFAGASKSLRHRVEEELLRDVRRILLTHSHFDHADGLESRGDVRRHHRSHLWEGLRGRHRQQPGPAIS